VARINVPAAAGGMGLFNVEEFLIAQQCCWVFRAHISCRDNWRNDLITLSLGNALIFSPDNVEKRRHPILFCIASSFQRLRAVFYKKNENYLSSCILFNPTLFRETRDKTHLTPEYLDIHDNTTLCYEIAKMEFQDFCDENGPLSHAQLVRSGITLSALGYGRLSNALNCFFERVGDAGDTEPSENLTESFVSIKKPGRKCRILLGSTRGNNLDKLTTTTTFFRLIGVDFIGCKHFSTNVSWWAHQFLPNRQRMFGFKFYNNILGLNTRTFHFAAAPNRNCFFCSASPHPTNTDETFLHLFLQCPTVRAWQEHFRIQELGGVILNDTDIRKLWFLGILPNIAGINDAILTAILLFQYCCWEEKLRKQRPSYHTLITIFKENLANIILSNPSLQELSATIPLPLFRNLRGP
jgi:hypothetical protein